MRTSLPRRIMLVASNLALRPPLDLAALVLVNTVLLVVLGLAGTSGTAVVR
jgi:hypothetical protein